MTDLHFAEPQWIHGLWVVILFLILMVWLERRGGGDLSLFVSKVLQPRLVRSASLMRRMLRIVFLGLSGALLVISLMRPQWGLQFVSTPKMGAEIMVCLDVSKSMMAEDVAPNRLERAKADLGDLLSYLNGDQVGLIAFAGRASVLSPLTPDFGFLRLVLGSAGSHSVTRGGTRLEEPIRKAIQGFGDTADVSRSILLITDGEDHDSFPLEAAKAAAERGIRILTIGFGDEDGSEIMITDPKTGARTLLRDSDGTIVKSRLDGDMLREISLITEGAYIPAGTGVLDLKSIYDVHIAGLTRGMLDGQGHSVRNDAFQFTLMLALLMLFAAVLSTVGGAPSAEQLRHKARGSVNLSVIGIVFVIAVVFTVLMTPQAHAEYQTVSANQQAQSTGSNVVNTHLPDAMAEDIDIKEIAIDNKAFQNGSTEGQAIEGQAIEGQTIEGQTIEDEIIDPRLLYNEALAQFDLGDWEGATKSFQKARTLARTDGELRFNATYNLGWVDVKKADSLLESEPEKALDALHSAADWFREAISLRSDVDARHNLEVVLSRALILADDINNNEPGDLLKQVNDAIDSQRAFLDSLREGVDLKAAASESNSTEAIRRSMRTMATQQLEVLSESQQLTETAGQELDSLQGKGSDEQTPEDRIRLVQLEGVLQYLHRSQEKMGQARRRMRTLQVERAYRRAAAALTELKRGRDQLLDPVTRIDVLLADGMELMQQTGAKAATLIGQVDLLEKDKLPSWLTIEYLKEGQQSLDERTEELHQGLSAGLATQSDGQQSSSEALQGQPQDPKQAELLANLREAVPLLGQARQEFGNAVIELESSRLADALKNQNTGITYLADARERFLDIRQLIELVYQDEMRIQQFVVGEEGTLESEIVEYLPLTAEMQDKNLQRVPRIGSLISTQLVEILGAKEKAQQSDDNNQAAPIPGSATAPTNTQPSLEQLESEEQRLQQADQLQLQIQREFRIARNNLQAAGLRSVDQPTTTLDQVRSSVVTATKSVEELRRLFFSVIEHLKEATRKQIELSDETKDVVTLAGASSRDETTLKMGPLRSAQQMLVSTSGAIGDALAKQADSIKNNPPTPTQPNPGAPGAQPKGPDPQQIAEMAEKFQQASNLVIDAQGEMKAAVNAMEDESITGTQDLFASIAPKQTAASERLLEAIALLEPPKQQEQNQDQQDQDQQDQDQQDQDQQDQDEQPNQEQGEQVQQEKPQERGDYDQMLQGVRDREKQRREEQEQKQRHGYEPVEKDW